LAEPTPPPREPVTPEHARMRVVPQGIRLGGWIRGYRRTDLGFDAVAGLTVAAVLVPQAMAYALLAGLPPQVGLYAAVVPLLVYALVGTSRHLAVGPVALVSVLTLSVLSNADAQTDAERVTAAATLALMVAVILVILGALRLGFLVNFISHSVLVGFTAGAAVVIAASQAKTILGVSFESAERLPAVLAALVRNADGTDWATLAIGLGTIVVLSLLRLRRPRWPNTLFVAAGATLVVVVFGLDDGSVATVGEIPQAVPGLALPSLDPSLMLHLLPGALLISAIGYVESFAIGKAYARRHGYRLRPNQEMVAVGLANAGSAMTGGYPVSGSFSRTAETSFSGGRTQLASVIAASAVLITILVLAPALAPMPRAALSGLIIVAVAGLVDVRELRRLWRVKRSDAVVALAAFAATIGLGVELGLVVALVVSLLMTGGRALRLGALEVGRVPGTDHFRSVHRFPEVEVDPGIGVLRVDGALSFLNSRGLRRRMAEIVAAREPDGPRAIVLDLSGLSDLDVSAEGALSEAIHDYARSGIAIHVAGAKGPVRDVLEQSGLWRRLGAAAHPSVADALAALAAMEAVEREGREAFPDPAGEPPTD
jgi:SulP family sulfate permease